MNKFKDFITNPHSQLLIAVLVILIGALLIFIIMRLTNKNKNLHSEIEMKDRIINEQQFLYAILDVAPISYVMVLDGAIIGFNFYFSTLFEFETQQLESIYCNKSDLYKINEMVRRGVSVSSYRTKLLTKNGERHFLISAGMIKKDIRDVMIYWCVDIEDSNRKTEELKQKNIILSNHDIYLNTLKNINTVLCSGWEYDWNETVETILMLVSITMESESVSIWRNFTDGEGKIYGKIISSRGLVNSDNKILFYDSIIPGVFVGDLQDKYILGNLSSENGFPYRELADFIKISDTADSVLILPIEIGDKFWGLLTILSSKNLVDLTLIELSIIRQYGIACATSILISEKTKKLELATKAKSDFLSNMSHEMRTPLNAVIGMAQALKQTNETLSDNASAQIDKIQIAGQHLLSVINDVLDMSKIEANKFQLSPISFDFREMFKKIKVIALFKIAESGLDFDYNISEDIPQYIFADEMRLSQVITNILYNAVKFTPRGGKISFNAKLISCDGNNCNLQISIKDTGIGMTPQQESHLFRPFEQADVTTTRNYGGTGLGLAISKEIIEAMNGEITVKTAPHEGSEFTFSIKAAVSEKVVQIDETTVEITDFTGLNILIADDVDINREVFAALLEPTNISITFAHNGQEALEIYSNDPDKYAMIFMDVQMPIMDGYTCARQIRRFERHTDKNRHIPIIAVTANVFKEEIDKCLGSGMDDHIGKPINIPIMLKKMNQYLKP